MIRSSLFPILITGLFLLAGFEVSAQLPEKQPEKVKEPKTFPIEDKPEKEANKNVLPVEKDQEIEGTLTEARVYFLTESAARKNDFIAFMGLKSNMPAVLVTEKNVAYYLSTVPHDLAKLAGKEVKVRGKLLSGPRIFQPEKWWIKTETGWKERIE